MTNLGPPYAPYLPDRIRLRLQVTETAPGVFCWVWQGATVANGYGRVRAAGRTDYVHRVTLAAYGVALVPGMVVDHLCHDPATCPGGVNCPHRGCANPHHLRQVTYRENTSTAASQRHPTWVHGRCAQGHDITPADATLLDGGRRRCAECRRAHDRARRHAGRAT
jgi:hypothetical protein